MHMGMDQIWILVLSVELQGRLGLMMLDAVIVPDRDKAELENWEFNWHR